MLRKIPCRAVVIREGIASVFLRLLKLENDQSNFLVVNTNLVVNIVLFGYNGKVVASDPFQRFAIVTTYKHT